MEPSPGYKTTEFWQSMMPMIFGFMVAAFGIYNDDLDIILVGAGMAGVSNGVYSGTRALVKAATVNANATVLAAKTTPTTPTTETKA